MSDTPMNASLQYTCIYSKMYPDSRFLSALCWTNESYSRSTIVELPVTGTGFRV
jgi:hypothetical protein